MIPEDTELHSFVTEYIRKIAHFTEYGLLGIEIALYIAFFAQDKKRLASLSPAVPFFVGFFDETIQCFSKRGPMIEDVWIDIGGFFTFSLLAWGGIFIAKAAVKKVRKVRSSDTGGS